MSLRQQSREVEEETLGGAKAQTGNSGSSVERQKVRESKRDVPMEITDSKRPIVCKPEQLTVYS